MDSECDRVFQVYSNTKPPYTKAPTRDQAIKRADSERDSNPIEIPKGWRVLETTGDFFRYIGLGETQVLVYKEDFFNGQPKRPDS